VEDPSDAVAAEIAHNRIAVALGVALDCVADGAYPETGPHDGNAAHHRLIGNVDQPLRLDRAALADEIHPAGIAVPAVEDHGAVDAENVALHQPALARDAVTDDVVDRGADRFGETAIVERRRDRIVIDDKPVTQAVEFAGGDPGTYIGSDEVERLS